MTKPSTFDDRDDDACDRACVRDVVSASVDACVRASRAIARVRSTTGDVEHVRKIANDPRSALTLADVEAQKIIVRALRRAFPKLSVRGEEDESALMMDAFSRVEDDDDDEDDDEPLRIDLIDDALKRAGANGAELHAMTCAWDELEAFVDPVDGTREFVEGRLDAVQCLIGIAREGRAIAGCVGLPFPSGDVERDKECVLFAFVGANEGDFGVVGVVGDRGTPNPIAYDDGDASATRVITGDSTNASLQSAKDVVREVVEAQGKACAFGVVGGVGNKLLAVAEGRADFAVMHFGTSLWDTCAPEAIVRARGGKVTDLFGAPLMHDSNASGGVVNRLGVIGSGASSAREHDAVCARARARADLRGLIDGFTAGTSSLATGGGGAQASERTT